MLSGKNNVLSLCVWKCSWFLVCLRVHQSWMVQVSSALTAVKKHRFVYTLCTAVFFKEVITTYQSQCNILVNHQI